MTASAVLVAAGRGVRMRSATRKGFLELAGRPLFVHAVETFAQVPRVAEIVLVVHRDDLDAARTAVAPIAPDALVVAGGATRRDSSIAGVRAAHGDVVLIHDGCRPFASLELVERILDAAERHGAAVPVLPSIDTLYRIADAEGIEAPGIARDVVDRASIGRVQTPQGFLRATILAALEAADPAITDDGSAVLAAGHPVVTVAGEPSNLKVTVPGDLRWAEAYVARTP